MDQPAFLPAAGFYPDPDVPGQHRYWDGNQWHASMPAYERPGLGEAFLPLAVILGVLLTLHVLLNFAMVVVQWWGATTVTDDLRRGVSTHSDLFDTLDLGLTLLSLLVLIGTIAPWCVWQYLLARSADRDKLRRSPGMHAGSWFIPVVALWFPVQNVRDLWASYRVSESRALVGWWWTCWILATISSQVVGELSEDVGDPDTFHTYAVAGIIDAALWTLTGVLAVLVVRALTVTARTREAERLAG